MKFRTSLAALASTLVLAAGLVPGLGTAQALPPGGASSDSPGTSGTVSPRQLQAGATITFSIAGFPGGEVVSVKIDDGEFCSAKGVHGACVVHQQKSAKDGTVRGSFQLPSDLAAGQHWLRFLASSEMTDDEGNYLGVKPYSLKGDTTFTVVAAGGTSPTTSGQGGASTGTGKSGTSASADSGAGATSSNGGNGTSTAPGAVAPTAGVDTSAAAGEAAATTGDETSATVPGALRIPAPSGSATSEPLAVQAPDTAPVTAAASAPSEPTPWLGLSVLVLCAGAAIGVLFAGRSGRRA